MDPLSNLHMTPHTRDRETVINASTAPSIRSRASSVFSTSTKFSIATLPQQDLAPPPGGSHVSGDGDGDHGESAAVSGPSFSLDPSSMTSSYSVSRPPVSRSFFPSRPMSMYSFRSTGGESLPAYEEAHPGYSRTSSASISPPTTPSTNHFTTANTTSTPSNATHAASLTPSPPSTFLPPFPTGESNNDDDNDEPFSSIPPTTLTQPPPTRDPDALISHYTTVLTHILHTHSPTHNLNDPDPSSSSSPSSATLPPPLLSQLRNTIDAAYRHELHARTQSLDRTRAALLARETDLETQLLSQRAAFSAQLAAQQTAFDTQLAALHAAQDTAVERARWQVEEIWEARWTSRGTLEAEEEKARRKREAEREGEWMERVRELRERLQEREEWWLERWEGREGEREKG